MASPITLTLTGLAVPAGLLDASGLGIAHLRPVYAAGHLTDLAYVRLNPAAQRWLALPEFPADILRTLAPTIPRCLPSTSRLFWRPRPATIPCRGRRAGGWRPSATASCW